MLYRYLIRDMCICILYVHIYIYNYIYIYIQLYIYTYLFIFGTLCSTVFLSWDEDHPPMGSNIA